MRFGTKLKQKFKQFSGPFSRKGGLFDYSEIHAFQKAFFTGFSIVKPSTLKEKLQAPNSDLSEYERTEGQYRDTALVLGYTASKILASGIGGLTAYFSGVFV